MHTDLTYRQGFSLRIRAVAPHFVTTLETTQMASRAFGSALEMFCRSGTSTSHTRSALKPFLDTSVITSGRSTFARNCASLALQYHNRRTLHLNVGGNHTFVLTHHERSPIPKDHVPWLIQLKDGRSMETYIDIARSIEAHVNKSVSKLLPLSARLPN